MAASLVIRGGQVLDGLGGRPVRADVAVAGQAIVAIGQDLDTGDAEVLDAGGCVVAPGFVDIHAHGDVYGLACPGAAARLHEGVTAELVGNCGDSPFPQTDEMLAERAGDAGRFGVAVDWRTLDDFAARHQAVGSAIHRGSMVGHATVRRAIMGEVARAPSPDELDAMAREVETAMEAGAFGLSSGLIYAPGMYADRAELEALCRVVRRRGGFYSSHLRDEGREVEAAVEELIAVGRRTGVRLQYSHAKVAGPRNWHKADRVIGRLKDVRAGGLDIACDRYPYAASSTSLSALLPGWVREGGEAMFRRLAEPHSRARIVAELEAVRRTEADWERVLLARAGGERWRHAEGRTVRQAAREAGIRPADLVVELLLAGRARASIVLFSMREENLLKWLRLPFVAVGSDGATRAIDGPTAEGKPHPRSYGSFARFLGRYVRERGLVSLAEGVRRITSLPASWMGLRRRGVLRPGAFADVTVFDPAAIADRATYQHPQQYSVGVRHVVVDGRVALAAGRPTGALAGRFLRRGSE
ncbi:MAG: N-acyl-D-amino-acid deacylase family protein [Candidatus Brocadiia bacterium]